MKAINALESSTWIVFIIFAIMFLIFCGLALDANLEVPIYNWLILICFLGMPLQVSFFLTIVHIARQISDINHHLKQLRHSTEPAVKKENP